MGFFCEGDIECSEVVWCGGEGGGDTDKVEAGGGRRLKEGQRVKPRFIYKREVVMGLFVVGPRILDFGFGFVCWVYLLNKGLIGF